MSRGLLVTGTDTGIGKTVVACAISRALAERGRIEVFKPVESGCQPSDEGLVAEDADRLRAAAGSRAPEDVVCPVRLEEPLAPWVAAERAGRAIPLELLTARYEELARESDLVIVESAGGLLVPIGPRFAYADLAAHLKLPILLVIGSRLGALNQALLTLEVCRHRGLEVVGYVLNDLSEELDLAQRTNAAALAKLTDAPCVGRMPYLPDPDDAAAQAAAGRPLAAAIFPQLFAD